MLRPALIALAIFLSLLPGSLGTTAAAPGTDFAAVVPRVAYALLPWTPFVPFVFLRPRRVTIARIVFVMAVVVGLVIEWRFPIVLRVAIACALGTTFDDLLREPRPLGLLALCSAAIAFLLVRDLSFDPTRVPHVRVVRLATIFVTGAVSAALILRPRLAR